MTCSRPFVAATPLLLGTLLFGGCTTGADALRTRDGGPPCTWQATSWRVVASGALTYDSRTSSEPVAFQGDVVHVEDATGTFTVTSGDGEVVIVLSPPPPTGLGALQVGATVNVRLEHGIVVDEWGNLVLSLTEGTGSTTENASLDVRTVFGAVHFEAAGVICTTASETDAGCTAGVTQMLGLASWGTGSAMVEPGRAVTTGWPYDLRLLASERPATEPELSAVTPQSAHLCTPEGVPRIAVAATAFASGGASPRCASWVLATPVLAGPPGWRVRASGALDYDTLSNTIGWDLDAMAQTGAIVSTNAALGSFTVQTTAGTLDVVVAPTPAAWLDALSVGRSVAMTFQNGVVVRDAATDELLLAVVAGAANPASLDVGPLHLSRGDNDCVQVRPASPPCDPGGVVVRTRVVASISLGATTATARRGDPPTSLSDGTRTYEVMLVESVSQTGSPANPVSSCDVGIREALYVAIGRGAP